VVGWVIADEPKTRPFLTRLRDGSLVAVLRSPLGRLFPGMTVIRFRGRHSGRDLMTPVECVREAGTVYVLVGRPEQKQWWRNVRANPDVTVEIDGRDVAGRASVHAGDSPEVERDAAVYLAHRPRAARVLGAGDDGQPIWSSARTGVAWVRIELRSVGSG
jgi:deazaflavin-dependent oxidoreductase (nitroreductase family)